MLAFSTTTARPENPPTGGVDSWLKGKTSVLVILAAFLPLFLLQCVRLWSLPHFQFFPLVFLGSALLAWSWAGNLGELACGTRKGVKWVLVLNWVLLLFAAMSVSPWLGAVATLLTLPVLAYLWGGSILLRSLLPAWILLWFVIPLPLGYDRYLINYLRSIATRSSSDILDSFGLIHLPLGNLIEVGDKSLSVEAACSGIQSLYVVLATTVFYLLMTRASFFRMAILLPAAVFWVLIGNLFRLVVVVSVYDRFKIDLTSGWKHELLGFVILTLTFLMIAGTDVLFTPLVAVVSKGWNVLRERWASWREDRTIWNEIQSGKDPLAGDTSPSQPDLEIEPVSLAKPGESPTRLPNLSGTGIASLPLVVLFGFLAVVQLTWLWPWLWKAVADFDGVALVQKVERTVVEQTIPTSDVGPLTFVKYEEFQRGKEQDAGQYSRTWLFNLGPHRVYASVDYPFVGWHDLTECYGAMGWISKGRSIETRRTPPWIEANFEMLSGRSAFLIYCMYDIDGDAVGLPVKEESLSDWFVNHRKNYEFWNPQTRKRQSEMFANTNQVQVFVEGPRPLNSIERRQVQEFFADFRERLETSISGRAQRQP